MFGRNKAIIINKAINKKQYLLENQFRIKHTRSVLTTAHSYSRRVLWGGHALE